MPAAIIEPIVCEVSVRVSPEEAFRHFSREFGHWWPREYAFSKQLLQGMYFGQDVGEWCYGRRCGRFPGGRGVRLWMAAVIEPVYGGGAAVIGVHDGAIRAREKKTGRLGLRKRNSFAGRFAPTLNRFGVIFSDGIEADFLEFTSGITARISVADKVGQLVH